MLSRTIAFLFGVLSLHQFTALPSWPWLLLVFPPILLFFLRPSWRYWSGPLAAFAFGLAWSAGHAHLQLADRLVPALEGEDLLVEGVVRSLPQSGQGRVRFELHPRRATLDGEPVELRAPLRLNWYGQTPSTLRPGQHWRLMVRLKRPWGMMNPGGFDYEGWLYQQGLGATGYVRQCAHNRLLADAILERPLQRLRHDLQRRLQQALGEHPARGVIMALAIGERGDMDERQWEVLLATGTNHLVAISGLHVGLVAGFAFFLIRAAWCRCSRCCLALPAPRAAALGGMLAGLVYAALAGFSIPTQRALIMLAVVLGAVLLQRPLAAGRALLVALWLVLLWQPSAVLVAGFWLSFAAVALILYGMHGRLDTRGLWWKWGRVQWVVSIGLLPLLFVFFGRGSLSAPLANLIAVPWVSMVVVPLTLIGTLLLLIADTPGRWVLQAAAMLFQWLWPVLEGLYAAVPVVQRPYALGPTLLAGLGLAWWMAPRGWPVRPLGLVLCLPLLWYRAPVPDEGEAWLTLLDVGQGQAAVVRTHRHVLVFDTGPGFPSGFNTGDAVLLPWLRHHGIERVDALVISHSDSDHLGGAPALVDGVVVDKVYSGEARRMEWIAYTPCGRGHAWEWDGVRFRFIHPGRALEARRHGNRDVCVLRIEAAGRAVLLTSDLDAHGERELLDSEEDLRADVLVAPHHGSAGASTPAFVAAVAPRHVLYSAGYRNRHGHPRDAVVARYREQGAEDRVTWRHGAITVRLSGTEVAVESYRDRARRYWHSP